MATELGNREAILRELSPWLLQQTFGSLRAVEVHSRLEKDHADELALFLAVTLPDPAGDTWNLDDSLGLRRRVREWLADKGWDLGVYVALRPQTPPPDEDEAPSA